MVGARASRLASPQRLCRTRSLRHRLQSRRTSRRKAEAAFRSLSLCGTSSPTASGAPSEPACSSSQVQSRPGPHPCCPRHQPPRLISASPAGRAARVFAGPAVIPSFVLAGVSCLFSALCYAELASAIPVSGSAYSYTYITLGEAAAWFIGWNLTLEVHACHLRPMSCCLHSSVSPSHLAWLPARLQTLLSCRISLSAQYGVSASAVARGWASYAASFFQAIGAPLPAALHGLPLFPGTILKSLSPLVSHTLTVQHTAPRTPSSSHRPHPFLAPLLSPISYLTPPRLPLPT